MLSNIFLPVHCHVEEEPHGEEVKDLHCAQGRKSHAKSHEPANVGEQVNKAVEFAPFLPHKVKIFEVDMQNCNIVFHVGVIQQVRLFLCGQIILKSFQNKI